MFFFFAVLKRRQCDVLVASFLACCVILKQVNYDVVDVFEAVNSVVDYVNLNLFSDSHYLIVLILACCEILKRVQYDVVVVMVVTVLIPVPGVFVALTIFELAFYVNLNLFSESHYLKLSCCFS